ncbi:hypothetical protein BS78_05G223200 [Paspalum vaginatum]|nr:hypothetical protein BS78_05G223200 [Paspalum vaginatum]
MDPTPNVLILTSRSRTTNELWLRHLLNLVTQVVVAGYVVSKSSWPDVRLRADMCLYSASPKSLGAQSLARLATTVRNLRGISQLSSRAASSSYKAYIKWTFEFDYRTDDIMSVDAPVNNVVIMRAVDLLPEVLEEFKSRPDIDKCMAYQYVGAILAQSYKYLYTKTPLVDILQRALYLSDVIDDLTTPTTVWYYYPVAMTLIALNILFMLTYSSFHSILAVIALVLFAAAEKEGHHSKVDVTVSYILLAGAIALDLLPALTTIVSYARKPFRPGTMAKCARLCAINCIQPQGCLTRKLWSEKLAQYSMIKRYTTSTQGHSISACMLSLGKWMSRHLGVFAWCVEFFEVTHTPITDHLKLVVLDRLFFQARTREWDFASFCEPEQPKYALHKSTSSTVKFPKSVLIWHIATEICYFTKDIGFDSLATKTDEVKKKVMMSRQLSHYIMYLVFKCDVMLATTSRYIHQDAHEELTKLLSHQRYSRIIVDEKKAVIQVFEGMERNKGKENEISANKDDETASSWIQELHRTTEAALGSVMHRAYEVAQELINIGKEDKQWDLISDMWLEMLFYTAPLCGAAFHYEHLNAGGEFITHVLLIMRHLGPFLPKLGT